MAPPSFVTVASFETSPAAWIFRNRLAARGLNPIVVDEHIVNMYWLYTSAVGGVKVQIPDTETVALEAALQQPDKYAFPDINSNTTTADLTTCPQCKSIEIHVAHWPKRLIFLIWLFIGFPIPIYAPTTTCADCGFERRPRFGIPRQFRIIHLLILMTLVALLLGIFIN